jgi:thiol-disulfide isomerase/thioredoxin
MPAAVAALKGAKDSIYVLAFGGTWCDDTKAILPKFYALADAAGLAQDRITLLGVDAEQKNNPAPFRNVQCNPRAYVYCT